MCDQFCICHCDFDGCDSYKQCDILDGFVFVYASVRLNDRKDDKHYVYLAVSQNFLKYFFASLYFKFIHNASNTALYDYDKTVYGFSTGFQFY